MENLSDQEVIEIPEDESSISLDGDAFKDGEDGAANVEASTEANADDQKETVAEKEERSERKEASDKKEEKRDVPGPEDFDDAELDSDAEDTGEGAEEREQELMNMPSLQSVMSDLGHLKQGRRVMVHPLRVPELAHPNVLETIQQASCEEIKLHFVRPQNNPEDWSGFLLMHFCSTRAAKEAVESLKAVRDDLTIKSEEGAAYANRTMEQWIRDEKGQKRWTDTLLWIKNISENVTEEQLKDVFCDAEDIVMRGDKDKDKKKDDQKKTKEAYIVYRTKDAAYAAAKEYSTQTIELDEEILKIYKYHVPQDQTPRGLMKLKERRLVLKYMKLLKDRIDSGNEEGSETKVPDWCSKRLETCKNLIERDDRARRQLGLDTPDLDELRSMTGVKVITGSDRKETLMQLGVLDRPRRSYQRDSRDFNRDFNRDSRDRKRMYDSRSSSRSSRNNSSLLGIPPSLTSLNAVPSMAMLMQQNLMGNMMMRQQAAMMGMGGFGGGMGPMGNSGMEPQRKMLRLDESGSFHVDYDRARSKGGRDSKGGGGSSRGSKPASLLDL